MPENAPLVSLTLPGMEDAGLSPIRRQYLELKRRRPDATRETFRQSGQLEQRMVRQTRIQGT